ncbi:MAG TPA: type 1 glutamine amidotransferase [Albitalea sp.]|uniref:type 1 glutamine amidotransferase n=1 Tax=Piscinibacter sp. TaxID=1903157 RepID=UPI002ED1BE7D
MKPVLILQHLDQDGPAYLATWLRRQQRPFELFNTEAGQEFPRHIEGHAGLAVLGGAMSANDAMPSLRQAEHLIREAIAAGVPVLGHCLGGQLMARALGARVTASPAPEIGWHPIGLVPGDEEATAWLGERRNPVVFQWHSEAFALPQGARSLAGSDACPHQAFALGPHLAMQFHVELDETKLRAWVDTDRVEGDGKNVQDGPSMLAGIARHLTSQQRLADRIYSRWAGFMRSS